MLFRDSAERAVQNMVRSLKKIRCTMKRYLEFSRLLCEIARGTAPIGEKWCKVAVNAVL